MAKSAKYQRLYCPNCLREFPIEALHIARLGYYRHTRACKLISGEARKLLRIYGIGLSRTVKGNGGGGHKGRNRRN